MNFELFHTLSFYALYGCLALAFGLSVERAIFYFYTKRHTLKLVELLASPTSVLSDLTHHLGEDGNVPAAAVKTMISERKEANTHEKLENLSQAVFIATKSKLHEHLWVLDTIVTAAPLLGLLGTILGIIETFTALAVAGNSDPKGVSAGIGTALFATALGISTALFVLILMNYFNDRAEHISDQMKILILRLSARE